MTIKVAGYSTVSTNQPIEEQTMPYYVISYEANTPSIDQSYEVFVEATNEYESLLAGLFLNLSGVDVNDGNIVDDLGRVISFELPQLVEPEHVPILKKYFSPFFITMSEIEADWNRYGIEAVKGQYEHDKKVYEHYRRWASERVATIAKNVAKSKS